MRQADMVPLFSVIIPTFNRRDYLREALRSVFEQECTDFEVIVVDDGSTEDVTTVIEEHGDRVRFIRQDNAGPGAARNRGAQAACGEYLAFLDSDDLWFPWTLRVYAAAIVANNQPALLAGRLLGFATDAELTPVRDQAARWEAYRDYFAAGCRGIDCSSGQTIVRRDVFERSGGFTVKRINAEDHDFVLRIGTEPQFVRVCEPAMIGYRRHSGGITNNLMKTFEGIIHLLRQERNAQYPGGDARRTERRRILTRHARPVSLALLASGDIFTPWHLYRQTFGWHIAQLRIRYLLGFPLIATCTSLARLLNGPVQPKAAIDA